MNEMIAVLCITILAVISPGADFAIVTKNSYLYGRKVGIFTSLGISLGVFVHVAYTLFAVSFVMHYTPQLLHIIKYIGAIYLVYIGYKTFIQRPSSDSQTNTALHASQAFKYGFLTNALNPKTTLFVVSVYTQIMSIATPKLILVAYGCFMSFTHFIWFSILAIFFSTSQLRQKMLAKQVQMNKVIGAILCLLGISLCFAKI